MLSVKPNSVHIHYDEASRKYRAKMSRDLKDDTGNYYQHEVEILEALLPLLQVLLTYWAILGPIGDMTRNAPEEDGSALVTAFTTPENLVLSSMLELPTGTPVTDAPTEDDFPVYDGDMDDWGVTTP